MLSKLQNTIAPVAFRAQRSDVQAFLYEEVSLLSILYFQAQLNFYIRYTTIKEELDLAILNGPVKSNLKVTTNSVENMNECLINIVSCTNKKFEGCSFPKHF